MKAVRIGEHVRSVFTWNPRASGNGQLIRYIDISSVSQTEKVISPPEPIPAADAPSRARQLVQSGDILVSTVRPNLNAVALVPDTLDGATASTGFTVLRADEERLCNQYLFHWVCSPAFVARMMQQATGQSYPAVSDKIVKSCEIPLPPLEEQRRIAAILDQADALRRLRRRALDRLNTLGQAIFQEMFGEDQVQQVKPLSEIAELINGDRSSNYPSGDDLKKEGVLFLNTKNIRNWQLDLEKTQHISEEKFRSLSRGKLQRGDIVITLRGTLGQAAIFDCDLDTGFINAQMMIIRPKSGISPQYLLDFLALDSTQNEMNRGQSGSAVKQLTAKQIGELSIVVPGEELQAAYTAKIALRQRVQRSLVSQIAAFDTLFASLQHRAFWGEV